MLHNNFYHNDVFLSYTCKPVENITSHEEGEKSRLINSTSSYIFFMIAGLPGRDRRGPMCYHCDHVASPDACDTVMPCDVAEICGIEQLDWTGMTHFKMACATRTVSF